METMKGDDTMSRKINVWEMFLTYGSKLVVGYNWFSGDLITAMPTISRKEMH